MKQVLRQLPKWFRHLLGAAAFLIITGLGTVPRTHPLRDPIGPLVLGCSILGLLSWIYLAKAGEFSSPGDPRWGRRVSQGARRWLPRVALASLPIIALLGAYQVYKDYRTGKWIFSSKRQDAYFEELEHQYRQHVKSATIVNLIPVEKIELLNVRLGRDRVAGQIRNNSGYRLTGVTLRVSALLGGKEIGGNLIDVELDVPPLQIRDFAERFSCPSISPEQVKLKLEVVRTRGGLAQD